MVNKRAITSSVVTIEDTQSGFVYKWDSERESWIIGNDKAYYSANAVIAGFRNCPVDLFIPRNFTYNDQTGPVETIGTYAFHQCAYQETCLTRSIFVTKQVKLIKSYGFSGMDYATNFTFESESELEIIESYGLRTIGYMTRSSSLTPYLFIPSNLTSIAEEGIYCCNLFWYIVYCGSNDFSINSSSLTYSTTLVTIILVLDVYPNDSMLGSAVEKTSESILQCNGIFEKQTSSMAFQAFGYFLALDMLWILVPGVHYWIPNMDSGEPKKEWKNHTKVTVDSDFFGLKNRHQKRENIS